MGNVIAFAQGKGGTGKSALSVFIAQALAERGKKVLLIDANTGLRTLDLYLGLENDVYYHLHDFVMGKQSLEEVILTKPDASNLSFIAASQTRDSSSLQGEEFKAKIDEIKDRFDFILIDAPTGVEHGMQSVCMACDLAVIVSGQQAIDLRCTDKTCMVLDQLGIRDRRLILNRMKSEECEEALLFISAQLLGKVPEDPQVSIAVGEGRALEAGPAYEAVKNITGRLLGEELPFMTFKKQETLLGRVGHLFGRRS